MSWDSRKLWKPPTSGLDALGRLPKHIIHQVVPSASVGFSEKWGEGDSLLLARLPRAQIRTFEIRVFLEL